MLNGETVMRLKRTPRTLARTVSELTPATEMRHCPDWPLRKFWHPSVSFAASVQVWVTVVDWPMIFTVMVTGTALTFEPDRKSVV